MKETGIPRRIEDFLLKYIHSIEQLEVLFLLHKEAQREWDVASVSAAIRTNPASAAARLQDLCARKLLVGRKTSAGDVFRFETTGDLRDTIDALAQFYKTHRHLVIEFVYSRPASAARAFASAFRLRKDDEE